MPIKNWLRGKGKPDGGDRPPVDGNEQPPDDLPPSPPKDGHSDGRYAISLEDITRGMQHAATAANRLIAHQYMQTLDPFFEHTNDGRLRPKTIEMALDDRHHFELPLVALTAPRGLMLDKMKVFLTVRSDAVQQLPTQLPEGEEGVSRFMVSLSPPSEQKQGRDSGHIDIEMQFTVLEPPECVMRVIEEYTRLVLPIPNNGE